jgi:hypothetical protein
LARNAKPPAPLGVGFCVNQSELLSSLLVFWLPESNPLHKRSLFWLMGKPLCHKDLRGSRLMRWGSKANVAKAKLTLPVNAKTGHFGGRCETDPFRLTAERAPAGFHEPRAALLWPHSWPHRHEILPSKSLRSPYRCPASRRVNTNSDGKPASCPFKQPNERRTESRSTSTEETEILIIPVESTLRGICVDSLGISWK